MANEHMGTGRFRAAEELFRKVLERRPEDAAALFGLGVIRGRTHRQDEAVELLHRAITANPSQPEYLAVLADILLTVGRFDEAWESVQRALELDPNSAAVHQMAADCCQRMRRLDEARAHVAKTLAINPDSLRAEFLLATILNQQGELDESRRRLERVIAGEREPRFLAPAHKELGFVLDRMGEHDVAFEMFEQSGREMATTPEARVLNRSLTLSRIADRKTAATPALLSKWTPDAFPNDLPAPVFLVGFPRSGTTLTEQVLGSHPNVITAEEKPLIASLERELTTRFPGDDLAAILPRLDADDIAALRAGYWRQAESLMETSLTDKVFIDKMPLNIIELDLINVVFPDARVIVVLRDPRDVCLSNFMQRFVLNSAMVNFLWWEQTAEFYARTMDFWLHIRPMLTLPFIEVRYEDMVDDLEAAARRLLDFIGVAWDEQVLRYYEQAGRKFIATPSAAAVSKPIYRSSVARWRCYESQVGRVAAKLRPYLTAFGYQ